MKEILTFILTLSLLITFCACSQEQIDTSIPGNTVNTIAPNATSDNTVDTDTETFEQFPLTAVSVPTVTETESLDDGTLLLSYTYQNMALTVPDPEVAEKIILDFLNRTDIHNDVVSITEQAQIDYNLSPSDWTPYLANVIYQPTRIDCGILSMYGTYSSYSGGAHGETIYQSVSYDLVTGDALTLSQILANNASAEKLCQTVLDTLKKHEDTALFFKGYENTVKSRFNSDYIQQADWFFSESGLCFFFSPYEIGPYSAGDIIAEVPYNQLTGILKDAYFPAERLKATGNIISVPFNQNDLDKYSQFAEIILDPDGKKNLFYTDKIVYDFRLEVGSWSEDGAKFIPEHVIFAAYSLSPGDAIMIQGQPSEKIPALRLSYNTDNKTEYSYISQDGTLNND